MMTLIERNNKEIICQLTLLEMDYYYRNYLLETSCGRFRNSYSIHCELNECNEIDSVSNAAKFSNEETLTDEEVQKIFCELTEENY